MSDSFIRNSFLICCGLFLIQCGSKKEDQNKNTPPPPTVVDVIIAQKSEVSFSIEVNGSVQANEYAELHPEVSGRLVYLNVPEGKSIAKGTVIARINNADLIAQLNKSKSQLELAAKTEERLYKLLTVNGVNQADYDAAVNQVNNLKSDIAFTQAQIDKTIIRAPFSGVIGLKQVSEGAYVTPATVIASIQQINKLKIDFTVPEEYMNFLAKGKTVEVQTAGAETQRQKATIIAIEPQIVAETRNIKVRAILDKPSASPGSFVTVYLGSDNNRKSILVPTNAIIPEDVDKMMVLVKNGKATFVKVKTGNRKAAGIEVTSGLNEGDSVVVSGVLFARPDAPLKVRTVKKIEELVKS